MKKHFQRPMSKAEARGNQTSDVTGQTSEVGLEARREKVQEQTLDAESFDSFTSRSLTFAHQVL
jgi:hypothetical protein